LALRCFRHIYFHFFHIAAFRHAADASCLRHYGLMLIIVITLFSPPPLRSMSATMMPLMLVIVTSPGCFHCRHAAIRHYATPLRRRRYFRDADAIFITLSLFCFCRCCLCCYVID